MGFEPICVGSIPATRAKKERRKMLSEENFVKAINELLALKNDEEELRKAFKKFDPDWNSISFGRYETLVVNILKDAIDDKYDYISWWLYEDVEKKVWSDDKEFILETPQQLYKYIRFDSKLFYRD